MCDPQPNMYRVFIFVIITLVGLFFMFLVPVYQGPDEQIHYGTIQYQAEPQEKSWPITEQRNVALIDDITSYHLSDETIAGGKLNQFDELKWQSENTQSFSPTGIIGINEDSFKQKTYKRYLTLSPSDTSGTRSFYYTLTSLSEKIFSYLHFSERFFLMRLFSLILYLGVIILTYQVAQRIFSSSLEQALFTLLVAFQPMLLATGTIVNIDIALIFSFTLCFFTLVTLLRRPSSKIFHLLLLFSLFLAFFSKGPGIVLIPLVCIFYLFLIQRHYHLDRLNFLKLFLLLSVLFSLSLLFLVPKGYFASITHLVPQSHFTSPLESLTTYFDKTISIDALLRAHASYWGHFGWLDAKISTTLLHTITLIELIAWLGIILFFLSKKAKDYLPKKSIVILSLGIVFLLQLAIRLYDWRVFDTTGKILIGTPGRYFLPTIVPHLLILVTGLGFLITKNKTQFTTLLKALTLGMILLCLYAVFDVIIPRYYL